MLPLIPNKDLSKLLEERLMRLVPVDHIGRKQTRGTGNVCRGDIRIKWLLFNLAIPEPTRSALAKFFGAAHL